MKTGFHAPRLYFLLSVGLALCLFLPVSADSQQPGAGTQGSSTGSPQYLDSNYGYLYHLPPSAFTPGRDELGTSVSGDAGSPCSVDGSGGAPCSVDANEGLCSVDGREGICSVDGREGNCSVDNTGGRCSVDPAAGACSVNSSIGPVCSVDRLGDGSCSVERGSGDRCSVDTLGGRCSIDAGAGECSIVPSGRRCSVVAAEGEALCSIEMPYGNGSGGTNSCSARVTRPEETGEGSICSVVGTGGDAVCSAGSVFERKRCSAVCDSGSFCSALQLDEDGGYCSTVGDGNHGCSILIPGPRDNGSSSFCSAAVGIGRSEGADAPLCSAGGNGRFQVCSVELPSVPSSQLNACSAATPMNGEGFGQAVCSILFHSSAPKAACSAFRAGRGKLCSAFSHASVCSVTLDIAGSDSLGKCTAYRYAPANSCSVQVTTESGAHCSFIGGPGGERCDRRYAPCTD